MNREIKFRAWDNVRKEWLLGYKECGGFSISGEMVLFGELECVVADMVQGRYGERGEDLIFQQYTGLKDKNDKEIYEGDIVEFLSAKNGETIRDEVIFTEGQFELKETWYSLFEALFHHFSETDPITLRVIGPACEINENP